MKFSSGKTSIIQALLIIIVILLGLNILLEKYSDKNKLVQKEISSRVINNKFLSALNNYNFDSTWIKIKPVSVYNDDSLKYFYSVKVPKDLPLSLLIKEITNQFDTNEVNIYATDFKSDASTDITISSGGFDKLKANLANSDDVKRQIDSIAFLITDLEDLNQDNLADLLMMPEHFACAFVPSASALKISKLLQEQQKHVAVLLKDNISELEFKLKNNYSDNRIRNSLKSINGKFNFASFFIIDDNSDIYKSTHSEEIIKWFSRKGIVKESKFREVSFTSPGDMFNFIKSGKDRLFIISAEDFMEMPPVLASLRKIGYQVVFPSGLLNE